MLSQHTFWSKYVNDQPLIIDMTNCKPQCLSSSAKSRQCGHTHTYIRCYSFIQTRMFSSTETWRHPRDCKTRSATQVSRDKFSCLRYWIASIKFLFSAYKDKMGQFFNTSGFKHFKPTVPKRCGKPSYWVRGATGSGRELPFVEKTTCKNLRFFPTWWSATAFLPQD